MTDTSGMAILENLNFTFEVNSETSQFLDIFDGWSLMYRKWPNKENWQPSLFDVEKHC